MTGQPKGHLWLVFTMLFVTFAMHGEGASSFAPPSLSISPTYDPVIKVIGKVYCYRCFNEAHPEESHGKRHLEALSAPTPPLHSYQSPPPTNQLS
uniref:U1-type domain-containing protein n=1 Tax=Setaria italica TaxID=4555 RepID=K3XQG6_SETIT